jgi:GNAT superfamily N-acetyltransferase
MHLLKETDGSQTIYRLKDAELDDTLGEAVVSEGENELRLHGIFVKPRFRGRGYGRIIMNAILGEACTKRVTLCTGLGNIWIFQAIRFRSHRCWRQFGFDGKKSD